MAEVVENNDVRVILVLSANTEAKSAGKKIL